MNRFTHKIKKEINGTFNATFHMGDYHVGIVYYNDDGTYNGCNLDHRYKEELHKIFESPDFKEEIKEFVDSNKGLDLFWWYRIDKTYYYVSDCGIVHEGDPDYFERRAKYYNAFPSEEFAELAINMSSEQRCKILIARCMYFDEEVSMYHFINRKYDKFIKESK